MTCVEKGIDHELVPVAYGSAEHLALNPFGGPAGARAGRRHGAVGARGAGYLDEAFPGPSLQPEDPVARTRVDGTWMGQCSDYLYRGVVRTVPPGRAPSDEERATARGVLENVDALIGPDPFLVGEQVDARGSLPGAAAPQLP